MGGIVEHMAMTREEEIVGPSDRAFGIVFTAVFLVVGLFPIWRGDAPRWWAIGAAAGILACALAWPGALAPANRLWLRVGLVLHRVVNPVVMALLFYGAVTPFGIAARLVQRRLVRRLRPDAALPTYWIERDGSASRMDQQF